MRIRANDDSRRVNLASIDTPGWILTALRVHIVELDRVLEQVFKKEHAHVASFIHSHHKFLASTSHQLHVIYFFLNTYATQELERDNLTWSFISSIFLRGLRSGMVHVTGSRVYTHNLSSTPTIRSPCFSLTTMIFIFYIPNHVREISDKHNQTYPIFHSS